jgi:hypothetical protein
MAGENSSYNDNIFVDFDCQNIVLVDPNKIQQADGTVRERQIHPEEFVMYANLEAKVLPRTKLAVGAPIDDAVQNVQLASINFLRPGGKTRLDNSYLDEITGLNAVNGKGTNQPGKANIQVENKPNEFYIKQNTLNSMDTGLMGIESIRVKNTRSATPTVEMVLIDTQGRALFEKGENSEYAAFFNLPYPMFYLTMKGYYGKAIKYQLILTNFSAAFEGNTGNYRISLKFYSYKYTILAETQVGALFATPFMYTSDFKVTATGAEPPSVQAARASVGNTTSPTVNVRTTKGAGFIKNMYSKYKALNLISKDLPELSLPELRARLDVLEKNLLESFGQEDFTPLSNIQSYFKLIQEFQEDVFSSNANSWFSQFIDPNKTFVYKTRKNDKEFITTSYVFNEKTIASEQTRQDAIATLRRIVNEYKTQLNKNPTLGLQGSFTVEGITDTSVRVKKLKNIFVNDPLKGLDQDGAVIPDTFRKSITIEEIDWAATYAVRNKIKGTELQVSALKVEEGVKYFRTQAIKLENQPVLLPTYNFVFEGNDYFSGIISLINNEINQAKEKVLLALSAFLEKKIEGPNGIGFRPSIKNIMAMIFASLEAFYLMMDDVHTQAWGQRLNKIRKQAVFNQVTTSASSDGKNNTPFTVNANNGLAEVPVYPWPQYIVNTNSPDGEQYELRYPGAPSEISKTGANNYEAWPEVQFVEEYIRGLARTADNPPIPTSDNNESRSIRRLSVNGVEFPMTNFPYSDYQAVKFLYEIYERVILAAYWDRLGKDGSNSLEVYKALSDIESLNIQTSLLGTSPQLTKILKNIAFTPVNYLGVLRQSSNDGTGPSWQQLIRGEFTSEYLRGITDVDFSLLSNDVIKNSALNTNQQTESLTKISEYIKSSTSTTTDITDLYPFTDTTWNSQNLSGYKLSTNVYNTTQSLFLNESNRFICNFQTDESYDSLLNSAIETSLNTGNRTAQNGLSGVNKPYTNGFNIESPNLTNSNGQTVNLSAFYTDRIIQRNYLPTEGNLFYENKTGRVSADQTTSMLNTPVFLNALMQDIDNQRNGSANPFVTSAYLFLNSLPLTTLREKYKTIQNSSVTELDYMFSTFTKFGGVHKLPYAWILKYGAIWYRYKTQITTGVDILNPVWNNINYVDLYDPTTLDVTKVYSFTDQKNSSIKLVLEDDSTTSLGPINITSSYMNVGFYPKVINNIYYMMTGQDLFSQYTDAEIQNAIDEGMNVGTIDSANINLPLGYDPQNILRNLSFNTWYASYDTDNSPKFPSSLKQQTILFPSFGSSYNQVYAECFSANTKYQEVFGNTAVYDGSARTFWQAPNFGYFELPSITKPDYNQYFKNFSPDSFSKDAFSLENNYDTIEEIFGVFKKEILDLFEERFLDFCRPLNTLSVDDMDGVVVTNRNFQSLLTEILSVDVIDRQLNYNDYVIKAGNAQTLKVGSVIQTLLEYNVVFRYGNPSNFNRKLFGSFTSNETNKVFDGYTWQPYIQNTLPGPGGNITFAQSQASSPAAWNALYQWVGFSTIPEMDYVGTSSYITDFFPAVNMAFTEDNVKTFAPMIKIFATQKLKNQGQYSGATFTTDINTYYQNGDEFVSEILKQLFFSLQKQLPNVEQTNDKPILSALDGDTSKLDFWESFKAFNDKWIAGADFQNRPLFQDVLFLDRANRDIGDVVLVDVIKLKEFFSGTTTMNTRVIDFVSKIIADNKFQMMPMPAYVNFWGLGDVTNGVRPTRTETSSDLANSLFGTFLEVDYRDSQPKLVCYYVGKPSEHLELKSNPEYQFKTDSFQFDCGGDQPLVDNLQNKTNWGQSNKVVAFNVDFGTRNQGVFYSIQLDQNSAAATSESNRVVTDIALQAGGRNAMSSSVGLFNFYKTRSYECRVESMGNVMIQPTMYFNLQHVPMFYGPYMIQSVEHVIDSGNFRTYFSGIRMPVYSIPLITQQLVSLNKNLLSQLVQQISRLKETTVVNPSKNIIAVGNSIQNNSEFTAANPAQCANDIAVANQRYRNFVGIDSPTLRSIAYNDFATIIKNNVADRVARGMVFFNAYVNGHDDTKIYAYDYDLGGTPLGGTIYQNISYAQRGEIYLRREYSCRSNQGVTAPYATFDSFQKSVEFIESYYLNKSGPQNKSIVYSNPSYKWNNKSDYAISLVQVWLEWWPTKRWNTEAEKEKWIKANQKNFNELVKAADEVTEKAISLGLISF